MTTSNDKTPKQITPPDQSVPFCYAKESSPLPFLWQNTKYLSHKSRAQISGENTVIRDSNRVLKNI